MSKKIFAAVLLAAFSFAAASGTPRAAVTNVKEVLNETDLVVEVRKYDTKPLAAGVQYETTREIPAGGGTWSGDMWVPWADNSNDFADKRMEILVDGRTVFWVWQSGDYVRFNNRARFVNNARRVSGESRAGGERRLIIRMSGRTPVFEFERF